MFKRSCRKPKRTYANLIMKQSEMFIILRFEISFF